MKTLTLDIDENSKKGKALIDFLIAYYSAKGDVQIVEIDGVKVNPDSELNAVAENSAEYKTSRKLKKEGKKISDSESESPYNPEFVKMVLDSAKSKNRTVLDPNDIWGSLGLK